MKKIILEEIYRIKELMGVKSLPLSEGIGDILRKLGTSFTDVSRFMGELPDDISKLLEDNIKLLTADGKMVNSIDEIADLMEKSPIIKSLVIKGLSQTSPVIANQIADIFTTSFASEWNRIVPKLQSGFNDISEMAEKTLKENYSFTDEVIDILKEKAGEIVAKGHDLKFQDKIIRKNAVLKELNTLKGSIKSWNEIPIKTRKLIEDGSYLLSDSEIETILSKKTPELRALWNYTKEALEKNKTLEKVIEDDGVYRIGPEFNRKMAEYGFGAIQGFSGLKLKYKILTYILLTGLLAGTAFNDAIKTLGAYDFIRGEIKRAGNLIFVRDSEVRKEVEPLAKVKFPDKNITNIIKSNNQPLEATVYFATNENLTDAIYRYNDTSKRWEYISGGDPGTPSKPVTKYKNTVDDFKKWAATDADLKNETDAIDKAKEVKDNIAGTVIEITLKNGTKRKYQLDNTETKFTY